MQCPKCQFENREDVRFCEKCGAKLELTCPSCGALVPPDRNFCGECGASLSPVTTAQDVTSAATDQVSPDTTLPEREAERRQLTVMFCDLVGSTALSTTLDPEDLREVITSFQDTCREAIQQYAGFIARYMGDGMLVYFGYPQAHEDDAERAVRAGLAIVRSMAELNAGIGKQYQVVLAVRIGVATGSVVVGDIVGEGAAEEAAVVGETPNLAARLQGVAEPNQVVVASGTRRLLGALFEYEDLGTRELKGIAQPAQVWRVVSEREVESRYEAKRVGGGLPLVGRQEELGLLVRSWQAAKEGHGQVVLIQGEAGIGKSRLLEALREHVAGEDYMWVAARCSPYHANSTLYPVIEHMKRVMGWKPEDGTEEKLEKLEATLTRQSLPPEEAVPLYAELLSLPLPEGRYAPLELSAKQKREQTLDAISGWLLEEAERTPVLQVWEDLHWADPTTLELLGLYIEQSPTVSMLNVLAYRPEFVPPWSMHSHMTPITLNRLERPEVEALIGYQANGKLMPSEVVEHILAKADGVPLYVEELTKTILESDYLHEEADRYTLTGPLSELSIPATLQDSLMARLDRLPTAREIAQWGAVLGREFTYEMLHSLAPLEEPVLQTGLGQLVNNELLYRRGRPPRSRYIFKHALIQDAAYQSLLKRTRQQYHQQVAALMEEQFPETTVTEPEVLAHHYTAAELHEQAANYWLKAGKAAVQRSAMLEASAHLIKGLEVIKSLPDGQARDRMELALQANLGPALRAAKGPATPEAGQAFARGYELSQQFGVTQNQCPVLFGLFYFHWARGHFREARRNAEELMKLAKTIGTDEQLLVGHSALGVLLWNVGENTSALPHLKKALAIYDPESHASLVSAYATEFGVFAQRYFGYVSFALGYPDRLLQSARDAVALARALKNPISLCYALAGASVALKLRREPEATLQLADELSAVATEQGFPTWSLYAAMARGWALAQLEQVQEGAAAFEKGWAGWQTAGTDVWRPWLGALLTEVYIKGGRTREALRLSEEELSRMAKGGENQFESLLLLTKGDARLAQDDPDELEAERYYREAIDVARKQSAKSWELRAATRLGCLWRDQRKHKKAHDLLVPIHDWFTEGFDTADLKEAKALMEELS